MKSVITLLVLFMGFSIIAKSQNSNPWPSSGYVGIGTGSATPKSVLEVKDYLPMLSISSDKPTEITVNSEALAGINFYKHYGLANAAAIKMLQAGGPGYYVPAHLAFYTSGGGDIYTSLPSERMRITSSGDIGVGVTDTKGYKLAVAGSAVAESVTVKLRGAWPDYVFDSTYQLPSLSEIKKYVSQNGRLPEMPSADQVEKEGLNLGEMNKLLTKKIEEMTLYMIELKETTIKQQDQINLLTKKIATIK